MHHELYAIRAAVASSVDDSQVSQKDLRHDIQALTALVTQPKIRESIVSKR